MCASPVTVPPPGSKTSRALSLTAMLLFACTTHAMDPVTFGGSSHYPPFHFQDDRGSAVGFDVDVFREIASTSDWQTRYRFDEWTAVQQALLSGDIDVVPMFISDERNDLYLFSAPIFVEYHLLFGPSGSLSNRSIESLSGYRVATENGSFASTEIRQQNPAVVVVATESEAAALQIVTSGDADFALLPATIARHTIAALQLDNIVALSPAMLPATYAFAVNPARPELLDSINRSIELMQSNNTLENLRRQWLFPEEQSSLWRDLRLLSWVVLALTLLTGLILAAYWWSRGKQDKALGVVRGRERVLRSALTRARKLYNHDPLTKLPNRKRFKAHIRHRLALAIAHHSPLAVGTVTLLSLDTIQDAINDDAGDELIKKFTDALKESVQQELAYLGPGQFAVLLEDMNSTQEAYLRMQEIITKVSRDLKVGEMTVHTQLCGGLAFYPDHADDETDLLHKAKLAATSARKSGSQLLIYSNSMKADPQKLRLMSDLKTTLMENRLEWALQPQYDVAAQRIMGSEILVRWQHPEYGWVPPGDFVVWAEETGIVGQITDAAMAHACSLLKTGIGSANTFHLSVNLSANDLADAAMVERIIDQSAQWACLLTLEITETALMRDVKTVMLNVDRLKQAGIRISLDDYGTGYSSLEYLKAFSFDEIKIDRMFINDIAHIDRNLKLTQASIELGHNLGATVVAEGVEDRECADLLINMGCDVLQGYYIGRPVIPTDFAEYLRESGRFHI
jgi:diguanylate cyclase (GGDEF)-like protein